MSVARDAIVEEARRWIGTPFRHQASVQGLGCDCLGLVRGVWRACLGEEPEPTPGYSADWAIATREERLAGAGFRHFGQVDPSRAEHGDILIFRWRRDLPASHLAIVSDASRVIHAHEGACVAEIHLPESWRRRIAFAFVFPHVRERVRQGAP